MLINLTNTSRSTIIHDKQQNYTKQLLVTNNEQINKTFTITSIGTADDVELIQKEKVR